MRNHLKICRFHEIAVEKREIAVEKRDAALAELDEVKMSSSTAHPTGIMKFLKPAVQFPTKCVKWIVLRKKIV